MVTPTRRQILSATAGCIGDLTINLADQKPQASQLPQQHIVGTATPTAVAATNRRATTVSHVLDFGWIGKAIVGKFPPQAIQKGDIITFRAGAVQGVQGDAPVVTHRVAKVNQTKNGVQLRTKGDGNEKRDPKPVAAKDVIG